MRLISALAPLFAMVLVSNKVPCTFLFLQAGNSQLLYNSVGLKIHESVVVCFIKAPGIQQAALKTLRLLHTENTSYDYKCNKSFED